MDLNKKKRILKTLNEKGRKNVLLFLPCVIIAFFVRLVYFIGLHLDMLLSDKEGRFLGLERKAKTPKKSSGRAVTKHVFTEGRHPSPLGRALSSALAVLIIVPFLPQISLPVAAAPRGDPEHIFLRGNTRYGYYDEDMADTSTMPEVVSVNSKSGWGYGTAVLSVRYKNPVTPSTNPLRAIRILQSIDGEKSEPLSDYEFNAKSITDSADTTQTLFVAGLDPAKKYAFFAQAYAMVDLYYEIVTPAQTHEDTVTGNIIIDVPEKKEWALVENETYEYYTDTNIPILDADNPNKTQLPVSSFNPVVKFDNPDYENGALSITWNSVDDADGYLVYRINTDATNPQPVPMANIKGNSNTSYPASGMVFEVLDPSTVYTYNIIAYQGVAEAFNEYKTTEAKYYILSPNENSDYKGIVSRIETPTPANIPAAPVADGMQIDWNDITKIKNSDPATAGYMVYRMTDEAIINEVLALDDDASSTAILSEAENLDLTRIVAISDKQAEIENSVSEYLDTSAGDGTVYYYAVAAYRRVPGESKKYESVPLIIPSSTQSRPSQVTGLSALPNDKTAYLKWNRMGNAADGYADTYIVTYSEIDENNNTVGSQKSVRVRDSLLKWDESGMTEPYKLPGGLVNGKRYEFTVAAELRGLLGPSSDSKIILVGGTPSMPQDITLSPSQNRITVSWEAVPGADYYELTHGKVDADSGLVTAWSEPVRVDGTTWIHEDIANYDTYSYKITAKKTVAAGTVTDGALTAEVRSSPQSPSHSAMVGTYVAPPTDGLVSVTKGVAKITWKAPPTQSPKIEGYVVTGTSSDGAKISPNTTSTSYSHTLPTTGATWTYTVQSYITLNGSRILSAPLDVDGTAKGDGTPTEPPSTAPATPQGFKATAKSDTVIDLSWVDSSKPYGYIIYGKKNAESNVTAAQIMASPDYNSGGIPASAKTYSHDNLKSGEKWSYVMVSYNLSGNSTVESPPTVVKTATTTGVSTEDPDPTATLSAPLDLVITTADGTATLTWKAVNGATSYTVYATSGNERLTFNISGTTFTHKDLLNGATWSYYVTGNKTVEGSLVHGPATPTYTVKIGVSLNQPVNFTAVSGNRQVDLSWSPVANAEGYIVYLYNQEAQEFRPVDVITASTFSAAGLINGRKYVYMVAAYKTVNGEKAVGPYSMTVTASPTLGSPQDLDTLLTVRGTAPYGMDYSELISASANHGAFDTDIDIYITTKDESTEQIKSYLNEFGNGVSDFIVYPFDITLYQADTRIEMEPNAGYTVTVTLPLPEELERYRDYIQVIHIDSVGDVEQPKTTMAEIENVWCIQFAVDSFSPFAFVIYKPQIVDVSSGFGNTAAAAGTIYTVSAVIPQAMITQTGFKVVTKKRREVFHIKAIEKAAR
ncbi:MAG: hypothetical protein LBM87_06085 [Ruminococcus sp.]|jgi:hypothetical protein|nr:hypothetical protein [Ruminococcus sp.]